MRTAKSILGLAVIGEDKGSKIGTIHDLIFDNETNRVLALVLAEKDLFGLIDAKIVKWDHVRSIGSDVVMVDSANSVTNVKNDEQIRAVAQRATCLSGTQVHTTDGKHIGTLADMYIDDADGHILGYQVSHGFLADTLHGKKFLAAEDTVALGQDSAMISPEAGAKIA